MRLTERHPWLFPWAVLTHLPWGVGCSIVYNYVDLVVRNDTATTFQLRTWVAERHLRGELRADRPTTTSYRVAGAPDPGRCG